MANKTFGTRQKLTFRIKLSDRSLKPRNPVAPAATQRAAGAHRQRRQRLLKKSLAGPDNE